MNGHGLKLMIQRLQALLPEDPGLKAWANEHFGRDLTAIVGNRPIEQIADHELPAVFIVTGEAGNEIEVGNHLQRPDVTVPIGLVWAEFDAETAVWQSAEVVDLMIQAVMRMPELANEDQSEACVGAHISQYRTDRGNVDHHPRHFADFQISANYEVFHP